MTSTSHDSSSSEDDVEVESDDGEDLEKQHAKKPRNTDAADDSDNADEGV